MAGSLVRSAIPPLAANKDDVAAGGRSRCVADAAGRTGAARVWVVHIYRSVNVSAGVKKKKKKKKRARRPNSARGREWA